MVRTMRSSKVIPTPVLRATTVALAFAAAAVGRALHASQDPASSAVAHLSHVLADAIPALPLAFVAVLAGRAAARRFRVPAPIAAAAAMAAGMIPASAAHHLLSGAGGHRMATTHAWSAAHAALEAVPAFFLFVAVTAVDLPRVVRVVRRTTGARMRIALALAALASALPALTPASAAVPTPFLSPLAIPATKSDPAIAIEMREADVQILPGPKTRMWTYDGTFPGPTIRRPSGQTTTVTFMNNLPAEAGSTTVHHHGNHSASSEDGQPDDFLIPRGESRQYTYDFVEDGKPERAALQWYHDHRMDVTGRNVWMGLAGMVILDDAVDAALPLPEGEFDVPLMVVDRKFDGNNQLIYSNNAEGMRGDTLLVNGVVQPYFDVAGAKYRLRLFNASNITEFEFAFADNTPMLQIATESGLLPAPVPRTRIRLGPAERAEVVVDFAGRNGQEVVLNNLAGFGSLRQVMKFRIGPNAIDFSSVPPVLRPADPIPDPPIVNTRVWALTQSLAGDLVWTINGLPYDPDRIDTFPLNPRLGTAERWFFVNTTPVNHVMHIHDVDWRLIRRLSAEPYPEDALQAELGLKESFLVRPNEIVEIVSRFTDHLGVYVLHCHVLEHEDRAMMAQFQVVA